MNTIYLVQETDYESTIIHFASEDLIFCRTTAVQLMRENSRIDSLDIKKLELETINTNPDLPIVCSYYREARDDTQNWRSIHVGDGIWIIYAREPTPEELEEQARKQVDPNRPDWLNPSSSSVSKPVFRVSNGFVDLRPNDPIGK